MSECQFVWYVFDSVMLRFNLDKKYKLDSLIHISDIYTSTSGLKNFLFSIKAYLKFNILFHITFDFAKKSVCLNSYKAWKTYAKFCR